MIAEVGAVASEPEGAQRRRLRVDDRARFGPATSLT